MSDPSAEARLRLLLTTAEPNQRARLLSTFLRERIAARLDVDASEIEARTELMSLNVSSLKAFELKLQLEEELGVSLRSSLLFDYPTLESLVPHVLSRLGLANASSPSAPTRPPSFMSPPRDPSIHDDVAAQLARELSELNFET